MTGYDSHPLPELRLIYRVLHRNLLSEEELMDSTFLSGLQSYLQTAARADGIDTSDHAAWDAWLGKSTPARSGLTLLDGGRQ